MYLTKLYIKFHIYIDNYKLLKLLETCYYSNYNVYFVGEKQNHHMFNLEYITLDQSFEKTIQTHMKTIPPNEYTIFIDNSIKDLSENLFLELNHLFLKHNCILINHTNPSIWCCKNGLIQNILQNTSTIQNLLSECLKLCNKNKTSDLFNSFIPKKRIVPSRHDNVELYFRKKEDEIVHIILATYHRNKNIDLVLNMLVSQSYKHFHVHLLDNNTDKQIQEELDTILLNFQNIKLTVHRKNENTHCFGRILCVQEIMQQHIMEYVVIFDDDQLYHNNWLKEMIEQRRPLCTLSWYGKIFEECDYWKSTITYKQIERKQRPEITDFHYFGPGGCIIDIHLFLFNELYDYEKYSQDIKAIDDIWMSFILKRFLNVQFTRKFEHPIRCIDWKDKSKMTWASIKNEKNTLFKELSQKYNWDVTKKNFKTYHVNDIFERIYILYQKEDNLKQINAKFQKYNICFQFVPIQNKDNIQKNKKKYNTIFIFDSNYEFDKFFLVKFDNFIKNINNDWSIMHLGKEFTINKQCHDSNNYGIKNLI